MSFKKWNYTSASVIGQAHVNQKTVCQDRLLCRTFSTETDGEVLIAAVADGAGSTTHGQIGAEIACEFFAEQVEKFLSSGNASVGALNEDFGKLWIEFFQTKIGEVAKETKLELREYATTLIAAIVGKDSAVFYQVGDGAAVFSINGELESYTFGIEPEDTEYVNMTEFLTDDAAANSLRFVCIEKPIEDVILFSDGIYAVAVDYQKNKPHEPFLMPMISPLRNGSSAEGLNEKLGNFLASPKLNEKTDDDKTIILASRAMAKTAENSVGS